MVEVEILNEIIKNQELDTVEYLLCLMPSLYIILKTHKERVFFFVANEVKIKRALFLLLLNI